MSGFNYFFNIQYLRSYLNGFLRLLRVLIGKNVILVEPEGFEELAHFFHGQVQEPVFECDEHCQRDVQEEACTVGQYVVPDTNG